MIATATRMTPTATHDPQHLATALTREARIDGVHGARALTDQWRAAGIPDDVLRAALQIAVAPLANTNQIHVAEASRDASEASNAPGVRRVLHVPPMGMGIATEATVFATALDATLRDPAYATATDALDASFDRTVAVLTEHQVRLGLSLSSAVTEQARFLTGSPREQDAQQRRVIERLIRPSSAETYPAITPARAALLRAALERQEASPGLEHGDALRAHISGRRAGRAALQRVTAGERQLAQDTATAAPAPRRVQPTATATPAVPGRTPSTQRPGGSTHGAE